MPPRKAKVSPRGAKQTQQEATPRRQSMRIKTTPRQQKLPTRSPYFEHSSDENQDESEDTSPEDDSAFEDPTSEQGHANANGSDATGEEEEVDDDLVEDSESEKEKHGKKRGRSQANGKKSTKKQKLKSNETVISLRAPSPGDTPYEDERIHSNTLQFLGDLKDNNDRDWLREHDGAYRAAKSDFEKFVEKMTTIMIEDVDSTIPELPLKDVLFRIYRDIRFSNDHTPYKYILSLSLQYVKRPLWYITNAVVGSRTGKKGPYACYYISIQPGKSMAGGGLWHPDAQPLSLLRRDIDRTPNRLKKILTGKDFATEFFDPGVGKDERKAVKAFAKHNSEDALKTAPKNFPKDHREIELLRLRSFTISKRLADHQITSPDLIETLKRIFKNMEPLITHLNSVVMPDINRDDESEGEGESSDGEEDSG